MQENIKEEKYERLLSIIDVLKMVGDLVIEKLAMKNTPRQEESLQSMKSIKIQEKMIGVMFINDLEKNIECDR